MITIGQIKAARSLLAWSQSDLAKMAGISLQGLGKLERGEVAPHQRTLTAIQKAIEAAGIEFIDGPGVRHQHEPLDIKMLDGKDALEILFEDFYQTLHKGGGELLVGGVSEKRFLKAASFPLMNYLRRVYKHRNITARLLVRTGDTDFIGSREKSIYRWAEDESFGLVPYYIYRDKYAVILWGPPLRIVIVHNPSLAETYRRQFEADWKRAKIPPENIPRIKIEE